MRTPTYIVVLSALLLTPAPASADRGGHQHLDKNERPYYWNNSRGLKHSSDGCSDQDRYHYYPPNNGVGHGYQIGWQNTSNRGRYNDPYFYRPTYRPSYTPFGELADEQIHRGIVNGRLSSREVSELRQKEEEIRRKQIAFSRDGFLSDSERGEIRGDIDEFHKKLSHELNDGEKRW